VLRVAPCVLAVFAARGRNSATRTRPRPLRSCASGSRRVFGWVPGTCEAGRVGFATKVAEDGHDGVWVADIGNDAASSATRTREDIFEVDSPQK